jgi:hypothetical protein
MPSCRIPAGRAAAGGDESRPIERVLAGAASFGGPIMTFITISYEDHMFTTRTSLWEYSKDIKSLFNKIAIKRVGEGEAQRRIQDLQSKARECTSSGAVEGPSSQISD